MTHFNESAFVELKQFGLLEPYIYSSSLPRDQEASRATQDRSFESGDNWQFRQNPVSSKLSF